MELNNAGAENACMQACTMAHIMTHTMTHTMSRSLSCYDTHAQQHNYNMHNYPTVPASCVEQQLFAPHTPPYL